MGDIDFDMSLGKAKSLLIRFERVIYFFTFCQEVRAKPFPPPTLGKASASVHINE